jgi:hypothetical protein
MTWDVAGNVATLHSGGRAYRRTAIRPSEAATRRSCGVNAIPCVSAAIEVYSCEHAAPPQ